MIVRLTVLFLFITASSCKTSGDTGDNTTQEVLVQLTDNAAISDLEKQFEDYRLQHQKVVSRPMNIYLFTYNSEKIEQAALIKQLKASTLVKEAQPNNNVQLRN